MKLAITGGSGFLGYHLCSSLSAKYDEIFILDIAPIERSEYPSNVKYFNADIRNLKAVNNIFKDADLVIHAAAALPLWKKRDIFDININGTANVLEAAEGNGIKRVVYVSSTAVYGIPKEHPIYEESPLVGVGPYGESKIAAERVCGEFRSKGMCVPIVRPKTFIGTGRLGVFYILYDWIENGKRIPIIGSGRNHYQLLEVDDLVDAIQILLEEPAEKANNVFNVGAEKFGTVMEDLSALCAFAATGARVLPTPAMAVKTLLILFEKLKLSPLYKWVYGTADKDSYVSIDRIKNSFVWLPRYSNSEALIRSYEWYLAHKSEISGKGITHRAAWAQGILSLIKKVM